MLDRLQSDLKTAMLEKNSARTMVLRSAITAFRNESVAKGLGPQGELSEAESLVVMKRLVKSREDSVEQFTKAGRSDKAEVEQVEIEILKTYMPAMLEGAALESAVKAAIAETGAQTKKDLGRVMKALQVAHGGNYDGKAANQIIQSILDMA
jgi:uncharacterized protein YqeY